MNIDSGPTGPSPRPGVRTTAELKALVRSATRTPERDTALVELVQRAPRGINRFLAEVAADPDAAEGMRAGAAAALGREATPTALTGLRGLVRVDDAVVARRAIERLGKVGTAADLDLLRSLRPRDRATQRALRAAKCFLSYRHGLSAYRFDDPKRPIPATPRSADLRFAPPAARVREQLALNPIHAPGLASVHALFEFECAGDDLIFATVGSAVLAGATVQRQSLPALIAQRDPETGRFEPAYYLVTDAGSTRAMRILGVRPSGRVALVGAGRVTSEGVEFNVAATEEPLAHPLTVHGLVDATSGAIRIDEARADPAFDSAQQARRRQPRPVSRPS
jgi:hypothetical protein